MNEQTNVQIFFHLLIKRDDHHKRGEDCTREIQYCLALLMRNNFQRAVIWLNGHANAFDWRWHYLKLTIKKRRKKQTTAIWPNRESLICKHSQLRTRVLLRESLICKRSQSKEQGRYCNQSRRMHLSKVLKLHCYNNLKWDEEWDDERSSSNFVLRLIEWEGRAIPKKIQ